VFRSALRFNPGHGHSTLCSPSQGVFGQHGKNLPEIDKINYLRRKVRIDPKIALQVDSHQPLIVAATLDEYCASLEKLFESKKFEFKDELLNRRQHQGQPALMYVQGIADLSREKWVPLPTKYSTVNISIAGMSEKHHSYMSQKFAQHRTAQSMAVLPPKKGGQFHPP
jgi:hypothetical protein